MYRWHEQTCSKPLISIAGGLPWCQTCCAVPLTEEDVHFHDDPSPPHPPSREGRQRCGLAWPAGVKYDEDNAREEGKSLPVGQTASELQFYTTGANEPGWSQAPRKATTETVRCKSYYPVLPPRGIRLLDITPGGRDDILHGNFRVVQLGASRLHYEALSYTWADASGNSQRCRAMYIGPFWDVVPITQNCEDALRSVRPRNDKLMQHTLWIDSVCVNQNDVTERTSQVALMPDIYSGAPGVLVYLGSATESSSIALEAMSHSLSTNACCHSPGKDICRKCRDAIHDLFLRPYFRRLWVVQEIMLSKSITLYCGALAASLPFSKILELLPEDAWMVRRSKEALDSKSDLLSLMIETGNCACKDPRDKVFALLGIPCDWPGAQVLPDYSLSLDEVSIGIASYFIQVCNLGWLVLMLARLTCTADVEHLPSWVPDLETSYKVFGLQKSLCDKFLRNPLRLNRTVFDHDDVFLRGRRNVKEVSDSRTEIPECIPLLFECWTDKEIQISSKKGHLRLAASKLCNVHEVFDMENIGNSRDILYTQAVSYPSTTSSRRGYNPMIKTRCAFPVLLVKKPRSTQAPPQEWSDFILKADDLYWLHGGDGYAILRPDPSRHTHTLVCVCDLVMDCKIGDHRLLAKSLLLRPMPVDHGPIVTELKERLKAMVALPYDIEASPVSPETNDEIVVATLAIHLADRLIEGGHRLWNELEDLRFELELHLANPDILECLVSELDDTVDKRWEDKRSGSSSNTAASWITTDPRSVAAFLWSIFPERFEILPKGFEILRSSREAKKVPDDRGMSLVYSTLNRCAELMHRLLKGLESGEFSDRPVDYGSSPEPRVSYLSTWNSSWQSFRLRAGLEEPLWDTPKGIVHVLELYQGLGTSLRPMASRPPEGRLEGAEIPHIWSWERMKRSHDFHQFERMKSDDRVNWIFGWGSRSIPVQEQLVARLYMQMCGLSWTSVVEVFIK